MAERQWRGTTEGTTWMHRSLIAAMRHLPLRLMYAGAEVFVVPFYMLFAHQGYSSMYHFFRRRLHRSPLQSFVGVYRNHCKFAQVILDRFCMYAGGKFDFAIDGYDRYQHLAKGESGFVILSAHVGNYEAAGYALTASHKRFNALVYGGEAETVMKNRQRILSENNIRMIPVREDMSHLFIMSNALADGESVSVPADRILGSPRYVECDFMGAKARFPLGPYAMAAQREVPVLAIHVMKEGTRRYHVYIHQLATSGQTFKERAAALAQQFASDLETVVHQYPTQWFNYYEFWS
ncbi:acyltransferase [Prevotella sp. kh1p2]|uniref:LpxL/LpxP family acyltransferase n=1 Tax=Prevotella sp. kh1p2 TaxID=1761883 RepID=UPI0008B0C97D|nr:acyltransferase [Prevotella sp. kh1p2]SET24923.1 Predicted acyltransferase, LPLAT superfamily [Prevotella sp. kh1p2]SNU12387.1 Predicted acyltransferase, LPLAT superfamily [Prevotellaceae bacterium KH2P17]